jgi:hypothetical protein
MTGRSEEVSHTLHKQELFSITDLDTLFRRFSPQDIEEFYQLYQIWSLRQKREEIIAQINQLEQQIVENRAHFEAVSPSPIALATLSQFRAAGVDDIDLLDHMLERGDEWLDHTLQLFEYCERLDMLQGNTTEWCIHALEGAYDWIESMGDINEKDDSDDTSSATSTDQSLAEVEPLPATTEADFLQKLMSEDGENEEVAYAIPPALPDIQKYSELTETTTQDLQPTEPDSIPEQIDPLTQPVSVPKPPSNAAQKRASQVRRPLKISRKKQKERHKHKNFNQYKRKQKKSR